MQVEILVDGDDVDVIDAGALETVTATAEFYDTRLGDSVGCDPEGCTAALTRVSRPSTHMAQVVPAVNA